MRAHVGDVIPFGLFTSHDEPPRLRVSLKIVGIGDLNNQVIQDDIDSAYGFIMVTPALSRESRAAAPQAILPTLYGLQLADRSPKAVSAIELKLVGLVPPQEQYEFHRTAPVVAQSEDAVRPESIALGAFGAIAALVTLVIGAQAVSRQLRRGDDERNLFRGLGAGPAVTIADGLPGVLGAIVAGALVAFAFAIALSPLTPLGPVRAVSRAGVALDWTVLGLGAIAIVVVLSAVALTIAYFDAPHRTARRHDQVRRRQSRVARAAADTGMPVPAVTGVRFALEHGGGRATVPVRSALLGTVVAVALVVTTLTFASGLRTLVSHPALYGWNWDYAISPTQEVPPTTRTLLAHDPNVAAWAGVDSIIADINDQQVPVLLGNPGAPVAPPIVEGHGLRANDEIVLGAATLATLGVHVGETVHFTYGSPANGPLYVPPTPLRVVGAATFPAIGFASFVADHTSMGTGAFASVGVEPPTLRKAIRRPGSQSQRTRLRLRADAQRLERGACAVRHATHRRRDRPRLRRRQERQRRQHCSRVRPTAGADRELSERRCRARRPRRDARVRRSARARAHPRGVRPQAPA